ncbi:hydroxyisourate hydrolase [Actinokineospora fastidiosa]|uniref:5-hydroxyisourate hydrolase n=1 Tax=Actinokineospora fastidiosa TaxID=1816 RepID=A0A918GN69_9PSEU|nr:5-hydroxyisourate hydrolase [Actinokineospora fastidiosa]
MSLSTHVLDTARGAPAAGVPVRHEYRDDDGAWVLAEVGATDADGRITGWSAAPGVHRLTFDTAAYLGADAFYPSAAVEFRVADDRHHHVPLLLSPFGYTTYRGS